MGRFLAQVAIALIAIAVGVDLGRPLLAGHRAAATYTESGYRRWQVCGLVVRWNRPLKTSDCLWTATARADQEQSFLVRLFLGERAAETLQAAARDQWGYGWSFYAFQAVLAGALMLAGVGRAGLAAWELVSMRQPQTTQVMLASGRTQVIDPPELEDWA